MDFTNDFVIKDGYLSEYNGTKSEIIIPDGVKIIGFEAFMDRVDIVSVKIPESVTHIDYAAFLRCRNITEINLPDSLIEIGMGAFAACTSLEKIKIPEKVKKIGCSAFLDCTSLSVVDFYAEKCKDIASEGNYNYYTYTDYGNFYDDIYPVFSGCKSLKTVNIGPKVKWIPSELFNSPACLEEVNVLGTKKLSVRFNAFGDSVDLTNVLCNNDAEIIFEPYKNQQFPEFCAKKGDTVIHDEFGVGEVEEIIKDKGMVKVKFYGYYYKRDAEKFFYYPSAFYEKKLKIENNYF